MRSFAEFFGFATRCLQKYCFVLRSLCNLLPNFAAVKKTIAMHCPDGGMVDTKDLKSFGQ